MRRGIAGLLFFIAAICLAVAAGGWWLQRIAFTPSFSSGVAGDVLDDPDIRAQVITVVANAAAPSLGITATELAPRVDAVLQSDDAAVRDVLEDIVEQSHARLIGTRDEPVQLTGAQMVQIVRDERAGALPAVTLPVEEVGVLSTVRVGLGWFVPVTAIAGVLALLLGIFTHPRRTDAVFGIGAFCLIGAAATLLLGYAVPAYLLPLVNDDPWTAAIPAVAKATMPTMIAGAAVLVVVGVGLMIASSSVRRRRSWSTPVTTSRYSDQRRWS